MSAGQFLNAFYEADGGQVAPIRIQPETAALVIDGVTNTIPAGPADQIAFARVGAGRRSLNLNARLVSLRFTGAVPDGYAPNSVIRVPWLNPTTFNALPRNATGTYLGAGVELVGRTGEDTP